MRRKWLTALSIVMVISIILAGCGNSKDNNTADSQDNSKDQENNTQAAEPVTLKLMQFKSEIGDQMKAMAAEYTKQYPNVTIEAETPQDYDTLIKTRIAAGEVPDIFMVRPYQQMSDYADRLVDLSNEAWMDQVVETAYEGMTVDGKKLGFPIALEGYGFIYNKDMFAKAGITDVPKTLTELKDANEKLKSAGIASFSEAYKEWWVIGQHLFSLPFAYEPNAMEAVKKINNGEMKIKDLAAMDGFFEMLDMTLDYGKGSSSLGFNYDAQVADFAMGKTAMLQQGVWAIDPIRKIDASINMGMFAIPLTENAADTKLPVSVPSYLAISKTSKNVEEAKKFLSWLHENGQKYLVESFRLIPAFSDLTTPSDFGPLAESLTAYVQSNQTIPWAFTLWPAGANQDSGTALQAYVGGATDKEKTIEEIQKIWDMRIQK